MENYDISKSQFIIEKIREQKPLVDKTQYAHNIISMRLNQLQKECGYTDEQVKKVIKRMGLDKLGWEV